MTRGEALKWGRGDRRRLAAPDYPASVLELVDERQGGRYCVACRASGLVTPEAEPLEVDHKQPLAKGGDNRAINLQWLCRGHNRGKGSRREAPRPPAWARRAPRGPSR